MARTPLFDALRRAARLSWAAHRAQQPTEAFVRKAADDYSAWRLSRRDALHLAGALAAIPILGCDDDGPSAGQSGDGGVGGEGGMGGAGGMGGDGGAGGSGAEGGAGGGNLDNTDIAIIGGGLAGVHCAHRLNEAGARVTLYEASERIGGRTFTTRDSFPGGMVAELGGELIDTGHATMHALATEFGLSLDDLDSDGPEIRKDTWYFNGMMIDEATISAAFAPLAVVMGETVAAAEEDDDLFAQIDAMSISEWLTAQGTDALLQQILEVAYTGEYGLEPDQQSVFNLLYLIDYEEADPFHIFGDSDERYHCRTGSQSFAESLSTSLDGKIETDAKLMSVRALPDGRFVLTFARTGGGTLEATVDHVVFAIPFTTLRNVEILAYELPELKRQAIDEMGYGTNAKLMMGFDEKIWRTQHMASGSTTADQDIQNLWDTARGQPGAQGILTNFVGGARGLATGDGTPESQAAIVLPKIDAIYPGAQAGYRADSAIRMHWPTAPNNLGSYACYRPGQWAFYGEEGTRVGNLHFCGEHTSAEFQGYMEGAAETGALVAEAILADLGVARSEEMLRALQTKLALPQPALHRARGAGSTLPQQRYAKRRKLYKQALAKAVAQGLAPAPKHRKPRIGR